MFGKTRIIINQGNRICDLDEKIENYEFKLLKEMNKNKDMANVMKSTIYGLEKMTRLIRDDIDEIEKARQCISIMESIVKINKKELDRLANQSSSCDNFRYN